MQETHTTITLGDGRKLGYAQFGDPHGTPVFYFHGFPGSRVEAHLLHDIAARRGVRVIALERPGYGLSDFLPGRTIVDWPADVAEAADTFGLDRFAVIGISGGGPYACACARYLGERLTTAAIVCGLGPVESHDAREPMMHAARLGFFLGRNTPGLLRLVYRGLGSMIADRTENILDAWTHRAPQPDRAVLTDPAMRSMLLATFREAVRSGADGLAHDLILYSRPWGFELEEIAVPVVLWHGEVDATVPPSHGREVARRIHQCRATFYPGEGHFSIAVNHAEEIVQAIMG